MSGPTTGKCCGLVGELSCPLLAFGDIGTLGLSRAVLFGELGAFVKRVGYAVQCRCQAFGSLPVTACDALDGALTVGGFALD
jgi:hypothetical protein